MKKLFTILTIIIILFGCGVDDNDDDSCKNIVPIITDVSFHDCNCEDDKTDYNNLTYEFNSGDCFDYIIYATDCDLDMATLHMLWCYIGDIEDTCSYYSSLLPDREWVENGYHLAKCGIMPTEPGNYRVEFQIEDHGGHISNIFEVLIEVE